MNNKKSGISELWNPWTDCHKIWIFKIQDGRQPLFLKLNLNMPFLCNRLSYRNEMWQDDMQATPNPKNAWKFEFFKTKMPLFFKNCHICAKVKALTMKFGRMKLHPILNPIWHMKIWIFKNLRWRRLLFIYF